MSCFSKCFLSIFSFLFFVLPGLSNASQKIHYPPTDVECNFSKHSPTPCQGIDQNLGVDHWSVNAIPGTYHFLQAFDWGDSISFTYELNGYIVAFHTFFDVKPVLTNSAWKDNWCRGSANDCPFTNTPMLKNK